MTESRRVKGYPHDEVRQRERLELVTYEYDMPFNYPNITVWRQHAAGNEFHGVELATTNPPTQGARLTRVEPGRWTLNADFLCRTPRRGLGAFPGVGVGHVSRRGTRIGRRLGRRGS